MKVTENELTQIIKEECIRALNIIKENKLITEKFSPEVTKIIQDHGGLMNSGYRFDARSSNHLDNPLDKANFKGIMDKEMAAKLRELELFQYIQNYVVELNDGCFAVLVADIDDYVDMNAKQDDRVEKYYNNNYAGGDNKTTYSDIRGHQMLGDVAAYARHKEHQQNNHKQ